jgi:hypothetical protein
LKARGFHGKFSAAFAAFAAFAVAIFAEPSFLPDWAFFGRSFPAVAHSNAA